MRRPAFVLLAALAVALSLSLGASGGTTLAAKPPRPTPTPTPAPVTQATPCQPTQHWAAGEVTVWWFDVEQGDSQLIIGPTGRTLLIDLGESAFNSTGANTHATRIAGVTSASTVGG